MSQSETQSGQSTRSRPQSPIEGYTERVGLAMEAQKAVLGEMLDINRHMLERVRADGAIAGELMKSLTVAKSAPELLNAWREYGSRRLEHAIEDSEWALTNSFRMMEFSASIFSKVKNDARSIDPAQVGIGSSNG